MAKKRWIARKIFIPHYHEERITNYLHYEDDSALVFMIYNKDIDGFNLHIEGVNVEVDAFVDLLQDEMYHYELEMNR